MAGDNKHTSFGDLRDASGNKINPATEDKQDIIIDNQTNGSQKTKIVDSIGNVWELEENGGMPVNIQDQATPTVILPMARQVAISTLTADTVINGYTISVASVTSFAIGQHIRIINALADRYYFGTILNIVGLVITLDTPIDFIYIATSEVTVSTTNMAVDGSVTPVIFTLRTGSPSIPSNVDITRMIISCVADSPVTLTKFGNLAALTRGIVFRNVNGIQSNIFNAKTNQELDNLMYDLKIYEATNPAQDFDGFSGRLTFAGQEKLGVALRVPFDGNLEMLVQDNLLGLLDLRVILEGHVVAN